MVDGLGLFYQTSHFCQQTNSVKALKANNSQPARIECTSNLFKRVLL